MTGIEDVQRARRKRRSLLRWMGFCFCSALSPRLACWHIDRYGL